MQKQLIKLRWFHLKEQFLATERIIFSCSSTVNNNKLLWLIKGMNYAETRKTDTTVLLMFVVISFTEGLSR